MRVIAGTAPAAKRSYFDGNGKSAAPGNLIGRDALHHQGVVMLKLAQAVLAAATIAAVFTILTATSERLDAGPLPAAKEAVLKDCTQRPWPYLNCVGTPVGNPRIRLITTDRL